MQWYKLFNDINLEVQTKVVPTKGNLVYEYNPFRNYRLNQNMYEYQDSLYSLGDLWNIFRISMYCNATVKENNKIKSYTISAGSKTQAVAEAFGKIIEEAYSEGHNADRRNLEQALIEAKINNGWYNVPSNVTDPYLRESGELTDFITEQFNFSLEHPVHIVPQYSYDGSVNLIINDGINVPRLINSRFSATGKNTYEIVDRKGNNDTNIYDQGEQFDIDTSLYKRVIKIPKIDFRGVSAGGDLKVGNYHFYFKLSDADGNETDFVGESGLVSVFIGFNDYFSVTTGNKNENSFKCVNFQITNIDSSYDYVTVYYSRSTADGQENPIIEYKKIDKKYPVNNASVCNVIVTGYETMIDIAATDINLNYNIVDAVGTSAVCQNMLFLANVHKPDIPYIELQDLSLRFLPYLKQEEYAVDIDQNYAITTANRGYLDPQFIYNKTGYWGKEIYRFGIVYILNNGELSPVFNIRGNYDIGEFKEKNDDGTSNLYSDRPGEKCIDKQYTNIPVWDPNEALPTRKYVNYNEETFTLLEGGKVSQYENVKGVVSFNPSKDTNTIYSVDIRVDDATIQELKKLVKGYFFVRQTRIPTILAQGITIGIDKESHTPTIPTADGFLSDLSESLEKTHVTTEDINDVNFISEGFLTRYSFKFKKKSSGLFGKILKGVAIGVGVVALAAATVVTAGGALGAAGVIAGGAMAGTAAITTAAGAIAGVVGLTGMAAVGAVTAAVGVAVGAGIAIAGGIQELRYGVASIFAKKKLDGRNTQPPAGYKLVETDDSRKLSQDFLNRFIPKDPSNNIVAGIICPEYELNQAYYNQVFTGNNHLIELTNSQNINCLNGHSTNYFTNDERHFYVPAYYDRGVNTSHLFKIMPVPDNVKCIGIDNMLFRSRAGEAEEAWRYECIAEDYKSDKTKSSGDEDEETQSNKKINTDIIRGSFGAYLAFNDDDNRFQPAETVNIYIPEYSTANMENYFYLRMMDSSTFNAITDRFDIQDTDDQLIEPLSNIVGQEDRTCGYQINAYRGDCYLCQFTHRVVRNFNDPSVPYNDEIVDEDTWKDNYDPDNTEKYEQINLGDINAIQIGMWVTFKLRASSNLNIRTLDNSFVDENAMVGHPRGYFPYHPMSVEGTYKLPESQIQNKGFRKSLSERWNIEVPDVPHIKNWFGTRIMYSDVHINDAYKNGFRVFQGTNYRDYTREYGEIVKLISLNSNLLCVFEHGVAIIDVNSRTLTGQNAGGMVYVNSANVLPETPRVISDMFGSQWPESILKVPGKSGDTVQYVYGVDTVAKKIWRTDGVSFECISDLKVQEFLNNNISLGERELTPKIGIRNVKTHYNAFKRDVMFTFYDNTYGFEEKVWNLCWNEILGRNRNGWITFYSWVPSYMENINNIPFSFNRDTSKWIAKLGTSHTDNSFADGITLSNVVINNNGSVTNYTIPVEYITEQGEKKTIYYTGSGTGFIGGLSLSNRVLPEDQMFYDVIYTLERDNYQNYKMFEIKRLGYQTLPNGAKFAGQKVSVYGLFFKPGYSVNNLFSELYYRNKNNNSHADYESSRYNYINYDSDNKPVSLNTAALSLPIYKDITGKRINLKREEMLNPDKLVTLLNIKATIQLQDFDESVKLPDDYYNIKAGFESGTTLVDAGYYESVVAITPRWNLQFLSTDFWKHGQAGLIDIADDIYPTYWYGKQHPFEFEVIVHNDPSAHKIFTNLEIIANKAKPESFHYEIIGETYDFAKDKPNMYFRQEARKALWQYNGADICYNRNFLKVQPRQQPKSADLPHKYYYRQDTINEIEDYYHTKTLVGYSNLDANSLAYSYKHLSGSEIVYYPTRQEFRVWNHAPAVCIDDLLDTTNYWNKTKGITTHYTDKDGSVHRNQGDYSNTNSYSGGRSIIGANCRYLEDRWKVTINPIVVCYKNEYKKNIGSYIFNPNNSDWTDPNRPRIPVKNSPIPDQVWEHISNNGNSVEIPDDLYNLGYTAADMDTTNWLQNIDIYGYNFGGDQNRKEVDVRDKFMKVRIRYSGEELAVIDCLNTIYRISYS